MPENPEDLKKEKSLPIYIVDDDAMLRVSLRRFIISSGFPARTFSSARRFLEEVPCSGEGCLILDLNMPGMSGLELQQKLRESASPLKVIIITANDDPRDHESAFHCGAFGVFTKPFDEHELLSLVRKIQAN